MLPIKRRRFLAVVASCGAAFGSAVQATPAAAPSVWRGVAMGALASITIVHPDRRAAQALIANSVDEIERLERIFSLYRPDSALSHLNAAGELADPPQELVELLSFSLALARASGGAFDPTVQPLLRLYFEHFAKSGAAPAGPSTASLLYALQRVGFAAVEVRPDRIRLGRRGAAITLNGVAQGYVTDRVADLLRAGGLDNVLVNLGEGRALGQRSDGQPWRAVVANPADPTGGDPLFELSLGDAPDLLPALATSGGYGTQFGADPLLHHLLDPSTGRSANHFASVTVAAPRATLADGLSTALSVLSPTRADALLRAYPSARAWLVDTHGRIEVRGQNAI